MEIRTLTSEEERTAFGKITLYAFGPQRNSYKELFFPTKDMPNEWLYGAFENGTMMSTTILYPFEIKIRNKWFNMGGIGAVATKPEFRNRGIVRSIFQKLFSDMRESEVPISVLYPFKYSYYEQFGYRLAHEDVVYQFETADIKTKPVDNRYIREVESITDDIKSVYSQATIQYNHIIKRADWWWKTKEEENFKYVCYDDRDQPVGYLRMYFLKDPTPEWDTIKREYYSTFVLLECFWLDKSAKQAILNFLWKHRDQRKYVALVQPVDEPFTEMLTEPNHVLGRTVRPRSMARVVNVKALLEALEYPVKDFTVTLRIYDELCPWNDRTFGLSVNGPQVRVEERTVDKPDLEADIGAFTQLVVGFRTIKELLYLEYVNVDESKVDLFDALFPKCTNFLRDYF
ncbi:MAG: enhanced intracellular survival protein Eis [Candidatus Odinarchaeota archaeon]